MSLQQSQQPRLLGCLQCKIKMPLPEGEMDTRQAKTTDAQQYNVSGETSYSQRSSAAFRVVLPFIVLTQQSGLSQTPSGIYLACPSTLCAVPGPVLFLIHLGILPSSPHHTPTFPLAHCAAWALRKCRWKKGRKGREKNSLGLRSLQRKRASGPLTMRGLLPHIHVIASLTHGFPLRILEG